MANYTDEQKSKIEQMPVAVLVDAIVADPGSALVGMREFLVGEKFMTEAGTTYPHNGLIRDLLQNLNLPKLEEIVKPILSIGKLDEIRTQCRQRISDGMAVLANDEEANQFKAFLIALGDKVVNAAGEGFFGNRGDRESANEAAFMNQLRQRLNVASLPSM
jgi:hypothetical protein